MSRNLGRRSRPRSVHGALKVAVAPLALAVPFGVFTAAPASADHSQLIRCESSGNYRAVSPTGKYRGAYQFDYATWRSVGGTGDPAKASKAEQDKRATILYNRRGNSPWPVCGRGLNLNHGGVSSDDSRPATRAVTRTTTRKATPAKSTAKAAVKAKRSAAAKAKPAHSVEGRAYVVRSGDTLAKIANRKDVDGGWRALWAANKKTVRNPHLIYPGQRLVLPR